MISRPRLCGAATESANKKVGTDLAKLVIVESPAKAKSIGKYLGRGYEVVASMGHLRDLPKSTLGVDVDNDFEPRYIPIRGKDKTIKEIMGKVAKASAVYLATDPDREGEAISWHRGAAEYRSHRKKPRHL